MKNNNRQPGNSLMNSLPNNIELPKTESTSIDVTQERSRDAFRAREREMR